MSICCLATIFGLVFYSLIFFFKQKTAYEMRISDWSPDVCSSDLTGARVEWRSLLWVSRRSLRACFHPARALWHACGWSAHQSGEGPVRENPAVAGHRTDRLRPYRLRLDRKSDVKGTSVSVRVDIGGRSIINKKKISIKENEESRKTNNK